MNRNDVGSKIFIYQIFYDSESKSKLDPGFIPLDNSINPRPDWFEFFPILEFLKNNELDDDAWYGFLSPRFLEKTGIQAETVYSIIKNHSNDCDILLFSYAWDQLSYYLNPFEQGDVWHPGLSELSQYFFDSIGLPIDIKTMVTYSSTSVFSNYFIAKPIFWRRWLTIANLFFESVENGVISGMENDTSYVIPENKTPMKTFIQERLASVILYQGGLKVLSLNRSDTDPVFELLFNNDSTTRQLLKTCDLMKERYIKTNEKDYLSVYHKIRESIEIKQYK